MRSSDWMSDVCSSDLVLGQVIPSEPRDAYIARVAAVNAGIPIEAPALTVNRLCGSSVQSTISAAQMIALGECDIAVSGGAESMSRAPHVMTGARWGTKMGNLVAVDAMLTALSDPFRSEEHTSELQSLMRTS